VRDDGGAEQPHAYVVVPVRNAATVIPYQLEALRVQTVRNDLEVLIVDDASTDNTAEVVDKWIAHDGSGHFRLIRRPARGGPNAARNTGVAAARSDFLLFCDGDDIVDDGWSDALLAGRAEGVILWGTMRTLTTEAPPRTSPPLPKARGTRAAYGGNMAISRSIIERVDGFDENILAGGSEHDFVLRAERDAGATVTAVPTAVVHYRAPTSPWGRLAGQFRKERGRSYMRRKFGPDVFGSRLRSTAATWARLLILTPRAFADPAARLRVADLVGRLLGRSYWSFVPRPLLVNPARRRRRQR